MSVVKEFREFIARGNVVDLAVGVVIGAAFGKIVTSLVGDLITPLLGLVMGGIDLKKHNLVLRDNPEPKLVLTLNYGAFLQNIFDFLIVAVAIFALVKVVNRIRRPAPAAPPPPSKEVELLTEIRDALVKR